MNTKLLISLIIVVALIVSISVTVLNFQKDLDKIEAEKSNQQLLNDIEKENAETERLLNEFENN